MTDPTTPPESPEPPTDATVETPAEASPAASEPPPPEEVPVVAAEAAPEPQAPPAEPPPNALPPLSPERAAARRTRKGRFLGGVVVLCAAGTLAPGLITVAALQRANTVDPAPPLPALAHVREDAQAIRESLTRAQAEVAALAEPAFQMARIESKRAAYRGAILLEQEVRRVQQEQKHTLALEAALSRNPALAANASKKIPPVAPPMLEGFIKRVGLHSPPGSVEGEVVIDEAGQCIGGELPEGWKALWEASANGPAEIDGRVAWRAPVPSMPLHVMAVRKLPAAVEPVAFAGVSAHLERMEQSAQAVPSMLQAADGARETLESRMEEAALWGMLAAVLFSIAVFFEVRRRVVDPVRRLREEAERVRAGARPIAPEGASPLADIHAVLEDIAERLVMARAADEARASRQEILDGIMQACAEAQAGDLTARPRLGEGSEGLTALAVAHLIESVEERTLRARVLARALQDQLQHVDAVVAPQANPEARAAVDTLRARIENLAVVPQLLKTVCTRLETLAGTLTGHPTGEDVRKLAQALVPRANALSALLQEMGEHASRLTGFVSSSVPPVASGEALERARATAQELARETRSSSVERSFPALVGALRDLPQSQLEDALRAGEGETPTSH